MQWLLFHLVYPILWLVSKLPFKGLYLFSDFVCFIVYRIVGYRKKTVRYNLNLAFPEKSSEEKKIIEKKFYSHMCDMFLEMIKSISISKEELSKRFAITNPEVTLALEKQNQSALLLLGHYASYEWLTALQFIIKYKAYGVYKKIKNPYFDKMVHDIRARWNSGLLPNKIATLFIQKQHKEGIPSTYAFIADQSPKRSTKNYHTHFLGQNVPFFTGVERLAKKLDFPVMYLKVHKLKRGYYKSTFVMLAKEPKTVPDYQITDAFAHELESQIKNAPEYYLWTHKRFKHIQN